MFLGKCPYCKDGKIEIKEKKINSKKVKLYVCTKAKWKSEDGEMYELTSDSTCSFRIWQNSLSRYGKWINYKEIRELLENKTIEVELISKKYSKKVSYKKYITLDKEYGVSVIWD
jgi:hypothetical protein